MKLRIFLSLFVFVFSPLALGAQDAASEREAEKLRAERRAKLLEAIEGEIVHLKLPENRAFVSAKVGAAVWKNDAERGLTLFKTAIANLLEAQAAAEAIKNPNHQNHDLLMSQSLRPTIINTIASVDAEIALENFYKTRPLAIQRALAQGVSNLKISNSSSNGTYLAQQEINFEQRLMRLIADQKPERSIALLKENIKKHLSGETLEMLRKLWEKDPAAANALAGDVADRLISRAFFTGENAQINHELVNLANSILAEHVRDRSPQEKHLVFDDSKMRSLAGKLIAFYVERGQAMGYIPIQQLEPIAKRYFPASLEQLRKAVESTRGFGRHGIQVDERYAELMKNDPSAEKLIGEAKKFPMETRRSIYSNAANKLSSAGQYDRAIALLNDNFEDDALEGAVSSLNWYHAQHLINRGEFDAAESMILQFNDSNRISALTSLAMSIFHRDQNENRARAGAILQRVRSYLPAKPETNNELSQLLQLISTMVQIEPAEAFRNFEPVVEQINQVAEAWAIVSSFQGGNLRQGEYILSHGSNFGMYVDSSLFGAFARKDFARTVTLIESLSRREMRILMLFSLLDQGI